MVLENYKHIISITATISTIIQFMTGILICWSIKKKGAVGDISGFPFVAGVLGCSLWLCYGIMLEDAAMSIVNFVGLILQASYTLLYHFYTANKGTFQKQVGLVLSIVVLTVLYASWEPNFETAKFWIGLLCCATTLIFCAAPLAALGDVLRSRSTETLPFYLILANVLVAGQWFMYGVAIKNSFVMIPNLIGCLIAFLQLLLFAIFPSSNRKVHIPV